MSFELRRLTGDDALAFRDLRIAALENTPEAFSESPEDVREHGEPEWRARLETNVVFGLFDAGALLGLIQVDRYKSLATQHRAWLTAVYLDPKLRGKGAGRQLLEHAIAYSRTQGILQLHLGVNDHNKNIRSLYESFGFKAYGTEPRGLYAQGKYIDEVLMVLFLDNETQS